MGCLEIKGMRIGEGRPKTIISLMGATLEECLDTARMGIEAGVECFEYRADFADDVHDAQAMARTCRALGEALPGNPLLFTFRSTGQGGQLDLPTEEYAALNRAVIASGGVDLVDIEVGIGDGLVRELAADARAHGVASVVSFHDFSGTPSVGEMESLLERLIDLGADIPKIAVMAHGAEDALALLAATARVARAHADMPLLTMAMGREGSVTRLVGEQFGSALTFCSLERASAPGQVSVAQAVRIMEGLHEVLG